MSGKKSNLIALAIILLGMVAVLVWAPFSSADGGFVPGQKVYAARVTTAFYNACVVVSTNGQSVTPSGVDYRNPLFTVRKGEELTVVAKSSGEFRMWCEAKNVWAVRVKNRSGRISWVYEVDLTPTKPTATVDQVNAAGASLEDVMHTNFNHVFAILGSNHFYWKDPNTRVWILLLWDGKTQNPKPYWK